MPKPFAAFAPLMTPALAVTVTVPVPLIPKALPSILAGRVLAVTMTVLALMPIPPTLLDSIRPALSMVAVPVALIAGSG
jgi:hypothetical protein